MSTTESAPTITTGTWSVDPAHSRVGFSVRHMGITTIRGEFTEFDGTLEVGSDISSALAGGTVEVASVFTNQPQRDEHLRSPDFFDVEKFPTITFRSTRIEATDATSFSITGDLTIHGVTNEILLRAVVQGADVDQWGNDRVGLEVTGELSRGDYGMVFNMPLSSGVALVSDKVKLAIDISAVRQS